MKWAALLLGALCVAITGFDCAAQRQNDAQRLRASRVAPLAQVPIEALNEVEIALSDRPPWRFVRRGTAWRFPAYQDAYLRTPAFTSFLKTLVESGATLVQSEPPSLSSLASRADAELWVTLKSPGHTEEVWLGPGIPVSKAPAVYARHAGEDSLRHLHANPSTHLEREVRGAQGTPAGVPFIDRAVFPRATRPGPPAELWFHPPGADSLQGLVRQERPPKTSPTDVPFDPWIAVFADREVECLPKNVFAYLAFLDRLRFDTLAGSPPDHATHHLEWVTDAKRDTLWIGAATDAAASGTLVFAVRARQSAMVNAAKVALLIPTRAALTDSAFDLSTYEGAEPVRR